MPRLNRRAKCDEDLLALPGSTFDSKLVLGQQQVGATAQGVRMIVSEHSFPADNELFLQVPGQVIPGLRVRGSLLGGVPHLDCTSSTWTRHRDRLLRPRAASSRDVELRPLRCRRRFVRVRRWSRSTLHTMSTT